MNNDLTSKWMSEYTQYKVDNTLIPPNKYMKH